MSTVAIVGAGHVAGATAHALAVSDRVVRLQTGYLYHYAFVMLIGIAALVTWMMLGSSF